MRSAGSWVWCQLWDGAQLRKYFADLFYRAVDGIVDDLVLVPARALQFAMRYFEPSLDRSFRFGTAGTEAAFQLLIGAWPQKNSRHVRKLAADFFRPLDVDI